MIAVLLVHGLAALCAPAVVKRAGRSGFYLVALVPFASFVWLLTTTSRTYADPAGWTASLEWIPQLGITLSFRMDALAYMMSLLVLGVGALVLAYCARYFKADAQNIGSFAAQLVAFAGAMFGLVTADDLMVLFIFWEITSVLSFLLISYSRTKLAARRAALQALIITTAGGLAMLVGLLMLGHAAGTMRISGVLAAAPGLLGSPAVDVALALVLAGAVSKSALFPTHFWLPAAMAAPTPVSAYLHAAAMVKAGIYLVARLAPGFADTAWWLLITLTLGLGTMIFGGWVALRQFDLKLILAYGTVSQLGFITAVVGFGTADTAMAGLGMVVAHALFKATLFLTVGIIDHQAGTRDIRKLSGVGGRAPKLFVVAVIGAASMAGVPPLLGFVGKEAVLTAFVDQLPGPLAVVALVCVVLGSILTFAYSARFVWGGFARKPAEFSQLDAAADGQSVIGRFTPVRWDFLAAPAVLALVTVVLGLWPAPLEAAITPYQELFPGAAQSHVHLELWHGLTPALGLSALIIAAGALLYVGRRPVAALQDRIPRLPSGDFVYRKIINVLDLVAVWLTGRTQRGSLMFYLSVILVTAIVVPLIALFWYETPPLAGFRYGDTPAQLVTGVAMVVAALLVLTARKRFLAVLLVSVTGYGLALIFALHGAPDLALTQTLVETISLVAFVLALRSLPGPLWNRKPAGHRVFRAVFAVVFGVFMMALAMFSISSRGAARISLDLPEMAYKLGDGANVVNVILVDIRAWDTMGEITVLTVAATGIASLIFVKGRGDRLRSERHQLDADELKAIRGADAAAHSPHADTQQLEVARRFSARPDADPFLLAGRALAPERRSIIFEVVARLLFHTFMIVSVYLLIAGHNLPGGGFAGGLMASLALTLRYLAGGRFELERATPVNAGWMLGAGLAISSLYAIVPVFFGGSIMQSYTWQWDMWVFGHVKFVTATIFDIGVYLIVVGLVLDILRSLGGRIDERIERSAMESEKKRAGRGSRIRLTRSGPSVSATRVDEADGTGDPDAPRAPDASADADAPEGSVVRGDETSEVRP
ncbi:putative cation antiporter NADH dehydrogenase subunit [Kocuria varians]|uniref:Putative cation antiporter NADH dehydrogenase subunit n=1 Tax=Kocuria varians TaxID=1272 RepID=A0A4Y4DAB4_KOCVA|nr:Na+/H+ antiporter subunit A [Kocuria varians]GED00228.1 putative cation antiporter NADH dehydrogenase subunit [Kocuria varians]